MKKTYLSLLLITSFLFTNAQTTFITGKIIDKDTKEPLEYANIAIEGTTVGTITNKEGIFKLKLLVSANQPIVISYIGYKNQFFKKTTDLPRVIYLASTANDLQQVTVVADDVLTILRKAFQNIEKNYPQHLTKLTGFYRESAASKDEQYQYYSEAVLETVKTKYTKGFRFDNGQIKILKGRTNYFPGADTLNNLDFFGGAFFSTRADIAKKRHAFINPKEFKKYRYRLTGITELNGLPVYKIEFDNQSEQLAGGWEGTLYIDQQSYAYISAEYEMNEKGITRMNIRDGDPRFTRKTRGFKLEYQNIGGLWHVKKVNYRMLFRNNGLRQEVVLEDEYVVTAIQTDNIKPISFEERLGYTTILHNHVTNNFNPDFFEDHNIIEPPSKLKSKIKVVHKTSIPDTIKETRQQKIRRKTTQIMNKITFHQYIGLTSFKLGSQQYQVNFPSLNQTFQFPEDLPQAIRVFSYESKMGWDFNKKWTIIFGGALGVSKWADYRDIQLGLQYNLLLKKIGRPLLLQSALHFSYSRMGVKFESQEEEEANNLRIEQDIYRTDLVSLSLGQQSIALKPEMKLSYQIGKVAYLNLGLSYFIPLKQSTKLYADQNLDNEDSRGNYTDSHTTYAPIHPDFSILQNGNSLENDQTLFKQGRLSYNLGLMVHF